MYTPHKGLTSPAVTLLLLFSLLSLTAAAAVDSTDVPTFTSINTTTTSPAMGPSNLYGYYGSGYYGGWGYRSYGSSMDTGARIAIAVAIPCGCALIIGLVVGICCCRQKGVCCFAKSTPTTTNTTAGGNADAYNYVPNNTTDNNNNYNNPNPYANPNGVYYSGASGGDNGNYNYYNAAYPNPNTNPNSTINNNNNNPNYSYAPPAAAAPGAPPGYMLDGTTPNPSSNPSALPPAAYPYNNYMSPGNNVAQGYVLNGEGGAAAAVASPYGNGQYMYTPNPNPNGDGDAKPDSAPVPNPLYGDTYYNHRGEAKEGEKATTPTDSCGKK